MDSYTELVNFLMVRARLDKPMQNHPLDFFLSNPALTWMINILRANPKAAYHQIFKSNLKEDPLRTMALWAPSSNMLMFSILHLQPFTDQPVPRLYRNSPAGAAAEDCLTKDHPPQIWCSWILAGVIFSGYYSTWHVSKLYKQVTSSRNYISIFG